MMPVKCDFYDCIVEEGKKDLKNEYFNDRLYLINRIEFVGLACHMVRQWRNFIRVERGNILPHTYNKDIVRRPEVKSMKRVKRARIEEINVRGSPIKKHYHSIWNQTRKYTCK